MRARIETLGSQTIFTNEEVVTVQISLRRDDEDHFYPDLVNNVDLTLICESLFIINGELKTNIHYKGPPCAAKITESGREFAVYEGQIKFPRSSGRPDEPLLGSLTFDHRQDGINWIIRGSVHWNDTKTSKELVDTIDQPCEFKPTAPLPSMLNLIDTEHAEEIDNVQFSITTTHAAAGLPQVPLAAGISLRAACCRSNKFAIKRLRLLLKEDTIINCGDKQTLLPSRRWLIGDIRPSRPIRLYNDTTDLDDLLGNIYVDHPTLNASFEMNGVSHRFDLIIELTLEWPAGRHHVSRQTRKIVSVSPVEVLPRLSGSKYIPRRDSESNEEPFFDPAEITDTSDEEALESDSESGPDSVISVFSDHHAKRENDVSVPAITSTIYE